MSTKPKAGPWTWIMLGVLALAIFGVWEESANETARKAAIATTNWTPPVVNLPPDADTKYLTNMLKTFEDVGGIHSFSVNQATRMVTVYLGHGAATGHTVIMAKGFCDARGQRPLENSWTVNVSLRHSGAATSCVMRAGKGGK